MGSYYTSKQRIEILKEKDNGKTVKTIVVNIKYQEQLVYREKLYTVERTPELARRDLQIKCKSISERVIKNFNTKFDKS